MSNEIVLDKATIENNCQANNRYQREIPMENAFVTQMVDNGWELITGIDNNDSIATNFRVQIEQKNADIFFLDPLTNAEFDRMYTDLSKRKQVIASAKAIRDLYILTRDDGTIVYLTLFDSKNYDSNIFQIAQQVKSVGKNGRKSRFDVTLFVNGLPFVQIELKKSGTDIMQAFNQVERYRSNLDYRGLFSFVQFFIISNGANTRYFANSESAFSKSFVFKWTDEENNPIEKLPQFTNSFLTPNHVSEMVDKFMIIGTVESKLTVLRPYQVFGIKSSINQIANSQNNGFIWHTPGSGKTLTSFKLSQILSSLLDENGELMFSKVVFISDRKDINEQTAQEFTEFEANSFVPANSTRELVNLLGSEKSGDQVILTTIQKLHNAVGERHDEKMSKLTEAKIVVIIDECHRSQFGKMQEDIQNHFTNLRMIGFTGTPILKGGTADGRTTVDVFDELLHTYNMKNAISDGNVLPFSIDYPSTFMAKEEISNPDQKVIGLDTASIFSHPDRQKNIVQDIFSHMKLRSGNGKMNAIFATASIGELVKYMETFKQINAELPEEERLNVAAIYSNSENNGEDDGSTHYDALINDYNEVFGTGHTAKNSGAYVSDVLKAFKANSVNILVVVEMALTGFDSRLTNQLYIDKIIRNHSAIQAFSRTNRVHDADKQIAYVRCYRSMKEIVDQALRDYSNVLDLSEILAASFDELSALFQENVDILLAVAETPEAVSFMESEEEKKEFVVAFRDMNSTFKKIETFAEFNIEDFGIERQTIEDYRSNYLTLAHQHSYAGEIASVLDDFDFRIDEIETNIINVDYINQLINELEAEDDFGVNKIIKMIEESDIGLRSKKELLLEFLRDEYPKFFKPFNVPAAFEEFRIKKIEEQISDYLITADDVAELVKRWEFDGEFDKKYFRKVTQYTKFKDKITMSNKMSELFEETDGLRDFFNTHDRIGK